MSKSATYNNIVIGHGYEDAATGLTSNPVIAQSVVFPDGIDSTITRSDNGAVTNLTDFLTSRLHHDNFLSCISWLK